MRNNCPFCPLEHLTDWYYESEWNCDWHMVICRDLNNRDYRYRLLAVISGLHLSNEKMALCLRESLLEKAMAVAIAHIANGWAKEIAHIDTEHMLYPSHYHIQIGLK